MTKSKFTKKLNTSDNKLNMKPSIPSSGGITLRSGILMNIKIGISVDRASNWTEFQILSTEFQILSSINFCQDIYA